MDNSDISVIIAGIALVVSIATAIHQAIRTRGDAQLKREVYRATLLTKLVELKLWAERLHKLSDELMRQARRKDHHLLVDRLEKISSHQIPKVITNIDDSYDLIANEKNPSQVFLASSEHSFDSLLLKANDIEKELTASKDKFSQQHQNLAAAD